MGRYTLHRLLHLICTMNFLRVLFCFALWFIPRSKLVVFLHAANNNTPGRKSKCVLDQENNEHDWAGAGFRLSSWPPFTLSCSFALSLSRFPPPVWIHTPPKGLAIAAKNLPFSAVEPVAGKVERSSPYRCVVHGNRGIRPKTKLLISSLIPIPPKSYGGPNGGVGSSSSHASDGRLKGRTEG
jgi:hypothetical protein